MAGCGRSSNAAKMPWRSLRRFAEFAPEFREEQPADWERVTRDAWPPLCVGERFYLVAPWDWTAADSAGPPAS